MEEIKIIITIPLSRKKARGNGYISPYAGNFRMSGEQAEALSTLRAGLASDGQVLSNGRAVSNSTQALQWLLEAFGAALETAVLESSVPPSQSTGAGKNSAPRHSEALPGTEQIRA